MPSAKTKNTLLPSFEIKINGSQLAVERETQIIRVTVDEDVNLPGMFALGVNGLDDRQPTIPWLDDPQLSDLGAALEIKLGYAGELATLIKGEVIGLEPEFSRNRLPSLTVRGYDRRHRLQRGRKTRTFIQLKDSDIAAQIAQEAGLTAQVEDSKVTHDYMLQADQTDLAFLQERARQIQYEVMVDDRTLIFRPVANADSSVLTLTLEDDLLEFYPRLSSVGQVSEVAVRGWNFKEKEKILGESRAGDEVSTMGGQTNAASLVQSPFGDAVERISDRPILTQAEADQLAKARFNRAALALVIGEGICRGRTDLHAGAVITIDGIGIRFSGDYYVTAASHRYGPSGYYTHFTVRRNAS